MTKFEVKYSNGFKKSLKKCIKQGKDISKIIDVISKIANEEELDSKYRNHNLIDNRYYKNCKECHIEPDWLLIYQLYDDELILLLVTTGSHSNLF